MNLSNITCDKDNIMWVLDTNTVYIDKELCTTEIFCRYYFLHYKIEYNKFYNNLFTREFKLVEPIPTVFSTQPIDYNFRASIFGTELDLFNSVYSRPIINIVFRKIKKWLLNKIDTNNCMLGYKNNDKQQQFYLQNTSKINFMKPSRNIIEQFEYIKLYSVREELSDDRFKIHMNIKLEKLFWILDKLINNYYKFTDLITEFKFDFNFTSFTISNQFNNRSSFNSDIDDNGIKYEEEQPVNIVFYPIYFDFDEENNGVQENVKNIINILKELFPDELNISSNLFPRFNFRINNSIYFALGDSGKKFANPTNFSPPTDYNPANCVENNEKRCNLLNNKTKRISNHELCVFADGKCNENNVNQYKLLSIYKNKSTRDIYKMVGQEDIYMKIYNDYFLKKMIQ